MTPTSTTAAPTERQIEQLAERLFGACLGAIELHTVHLGVELGLYRALSEASGQTCDELASRTALASRYVREWLQSQAISGFVHLDGDAIETGRFTLAPGAYETLVDEHGPAYAGGLAAVLPPIGRIADDLLEAFRTGKGIPYERYGPGAVAAQEALNRPGYENSLVSEWLPQVPEVLARLQETDDPARVADLCCGAGWSSIALAEAFPHVTVDGFDSDEHSIARARRNAVERGVSDRVRFEVRDVTSGAGTREAHYDVAFVFEAIHDLAHPVDALAGCRRMLKQGAPLIVMDERVADALTAPGDEVERFMAAASVVWCTPQGHGRGSEVVGAVMRPQMLEDLARRAGFARTEILPIEHPFWRFYRLEH